MKMGFFGGLQKGICDPTLFLLEREVGLVGGHLKAPIFSFFFASLSPQISFAFFFVLPCSYISFGPAELGH